MAALITTQKAQVTAQAEAAFLGNPLQQSDDQREARIVEYGQRMERAVAVGDKKVANAWMRLMMAAIKSRPATYIAKLERDRGLG